MRTVYKLYQVDFKKHNDSEMTIEAVSRKGKVYVAYLKRSDERYWEGGSDFGFSTKRKFKGIVQEFLQDLVKEVKEYDNRWYSFHYVSRVEEDGNRPLTWEETAYGHSSQEEEPTFKGGVKFYTERYE